MIEVHSNKYRKPNYWVEEEGELLFESDDATEVIQWAIYDPCR